MLSGSPPAASLHSGTTRTNSVRVRYESAPPQNPLPDASARRLSAGGEPPLFHQLPAGAWTAQRVYPGHGPETTIGHEVLYNPFVTEVLNQEINHLGQKLTDVQLTLENDINKKIRIIAEGHLDLNRKLDDTLKFGNENEILLLRVTALENDMRRVKTKTG